VPAGFQASSDFSVKEKVIDGKHHQELSGEVSFFGSDRLVEVPGLHGVRVEIDPSVGYTTYVGLAFRAKTLVDILDDGTVCVRAEGVEATDTGGNAWRSARTVLDGNTVFAFFPPGAAPWPPISAPGPVPAYDVDLMNREIKRLGDLGKTAFAAFAESGPTRSVEVDGEGGVALGDGVKVFTRPPKEWGWATSTPIEYKGPLRIVLGPFFDRAVFVNVGAAPLRFGGSTLAQGQCVRLERFQGGVRFVFEGR
jgi:hypothetical protein